MTTAAGLPAVPAKTTLPPLVARCARRRRAPKSSPPGRLAQGQRGGTRGLIAADHETEGGLQPQATLRKAKSPGRSQGPNTGLFVSLTGHARRHTGLYAHNRMLSPDRTQQMTAPAMRSFNSSGTESKISTDFRLGTLRPTPMSLLAAHTTPPLRSEIKQLGRSRSIRPLVDIPARPCPLVDGAVGGTHPARQSGTT